MTDDLSDLIAKGKRKKVKSESTPRAKPKKQPDRLILYVKTQICQSCGSKYETPNDAILCQFDNIKTRISEWHEEYNSAPREIRTYEYQVAACQQCFESASLGREVITRKGE